MSNGFENWSKKDFSAFIKANEKYGRTELKSIADEIEGKTLEEIKEYSKVFWKRYQDLPGMR